MQTPTPQASAAAAPAVLGKGSGMGGPTLGGPGVGVQSLPNVPSGNETPAPRRKGYGLPCAKCNMYYESDLPACPICKSPQRVSPTSANVTVAPILQSSASSKLPSTAGAGALASALSAASDVPPAPEVLEEERERFLKELKAQIYQSHTQINPGPAGALSSRCIREAGHPETPGAAEVCRACYEQAQDSADRMEAALHMDVKDATNIIYTAVWADTSDPTKTYSNAAQAILHELRTRAGISVVPGVQKYSH